MAMKKKLAGIVAAAMTLTTMGAFGANAGVIVNTATPHYTDTTDNQTGSVSLGVIPYDGTHTDATAVSGQNESTDHIWSISVDNDALTWNVDRSTNGGTYSVQWNPSTHKYVGQQQQAPSVSYTLHTGETATRTVTLTNDSNFAVEYRTELTGLADTLTDLVTVTNGGNNIIPVFTTEGSNIKSTILTLDPTKLTDEIWTNSTVVAQDIGKDNTPGATKSIGTLAYTFSVPSSGGNPVADEGMYSGNSGGNG